MDRREAIGLGIAGALVSGRALAQTEAGYLPGDSQEFTSSHLMPSVSRFTRTRRVCVPRIT